MAGGRPRPALPETGPPRGAWPGCPSFAPFSAMRRLLQTKGPPEGPPPSWAASAARRRPRASASPFLPGRPPAVCHPRRAGPLRRPASPRQVRPFRALPLPLSLPLREAVRGGLSPAHQGPEPRSLQRPWLSPRLPRPRHSLPERGLMAWR